MKFSKYHGGGNDFVVVDDREETFDHLDKHLIQKICHRNFGVGADGILLLQNSSKAKYKMRIFNSDGSEAPSCGNGLSCFSRFIKDKILKNSDLEEVLDFHQTFSIETKAGLVKSIIKKNKVTLLMQDPKILKKKQRIYIKDKHFDICLIDSGVVHAVVFVDDITLDISILGKEIRNHSYFEPHGTNVNFAKINTDHIQIRTFEKGIEAETLCCGTGAIATAIAAYVHHKMFSPITLRFLSGDLIVTFEEKRGNVINTKLTSNVNYVYSGEFKLN